MILGGILNDAVTHFDVRIQQMPDAMIARMTGLEQRVMFHASQQSGWRR